MKKFIFVSLFISISATSAFTQSKTNEQIDTQIKRLNAGKNIELIYNPAGGNSKIFAHGEDFGSAPDNAAGVKSFSFGMAFFYADKTLTLPPNEINLTFWAQTKKPRFAEANNLKIYAGGEVLELGDARYAAKANEKMEYLNFKISRDNLTKIVKAADKVKMKIGNAEFYFTTEHRKIFADLLKISDPNLL